MGRAFEIRLEALERELKELGESIRNACRELDQMIADGMMESAAVDEGFRWIWHLKRRREVMLNALGRRRKGKEDLIRPGEAGPTSQEADSRALDRARDGEGKGTGGTGDLIRPGEAGPPSPTGEGYGNGEGQGNEGTVTAHVD